MLHSFTDNPALLPVHSPVPGAFGLVEPDGPLTSLNFQINWTQEPLFLPGDKVRVEIDDVPQGADVPAEDGGLPAVSLLADGVNEIKLRYIKIDTSQILYTYTVTVTLPAPDPVARAVLTSMVGVKDAVQRTNKLTFSFDKNTFAKLEFNKIATPNDLRETLPDLTGNYGNPNPHVQTLRDLDPSENWAVRAKVSLDGVNWYTSGDDYLFSTDAVPVATNSTANFGEFGFGVNVQREVGLLDSTTQYDTAIVFTAQKSVRTNNLRFFNRFLTDFDVSNRAVVIPVNNNLTYDPGSIYRMAVDNNLSNVEASLLFCFNWSSGAQYGTYCFGPVENDVMLVKVTNGLPDMSQVIATSVTSFEPFSTPSGMVEIALDTIADIQANSQYAIVQYNKHPPVDGAAFIKNPNLIKSWIAAGNKGGYNSNDGSYLGSVQGMQGPWRSPAQGNTGTYACHRTPARDYWRKQGGGVPQAPWWGAEDYDNPGEWQGYSFFGWDVRTGINERSIEGNTQAKFSFTLPAGYNVLSDRIWTMCRYNRSSAPNGQNLVANIYKDGALVASAQMTPDVGVASNNRNPQGGGTVGLSYSFQNSWRMGQLSSNVMFDAGNYDVIYSSPAGSGFLLQASPVRSDFLVESDSGAFASTSEYSTNGGGSWSSYSDNATITGANYLGVQFVRVGQPDSRA